MTGTHLSGAICNFVSYLINAGGESLLTYGELIDGDSALRSLGP